MNYMYCWPSLFLAGYKTTGKHWPANRINRNDINRPEHKKYCGQRLGMVSAIKLNENIIMEQTFEDYLKQARQDFAKVASEYTVTEHLKLRTAIDSLLIAYDQAVSQALTIPVVSKCNEQFFALLKYAMPTNYKDLALERIVERYINESK
jgi:hypothetical protein